MNNNRTFGQKLSAFDCTSSVGLDKLSVICNDFEVDTVVPLDVFGERKKAGQDETTPNMLFKTKDGRPVFGSKACLNTSIANYTFTGNGTLIVNCNPSKVYFPKQAFKYGSKSLTGSWTLVTEAAQLNAVFEAVENDARTHGLNFDFGNSRTFRLDLAKQLEMTRPFSQYIDAFQSLKLKYSKSNNVQHGTQTFQYGSTASNTVVAFYDKLEELLKSEHQRPASSSNYLRSELRILNARTVERLTEARTPNELAKLDNGQRLHVFNDFVSRRLFYGRQVDLFSDEHSLRSLVLHFLKENGSTGKGTFRKVVQTVGVQSICEAVGIERFVQLYATILANNTDTSTETIGRNVRRYRSELYKLMDVAHACWKPIDVAELIEELRTSLVA